MKQLMILLLAICTLAGAMVLRHRRAVNSDENYAKPPTKIEICEPQTPCGWSMYSPNTKFVEINITNTYCVCEKGQECKFSEDDQTAFALVHRCQRKNTDTIETPES